MEKCVGERAVCVLVGGCGEGYASVNKIRYDMFVQIYQEKYGQLLSSFDGIDQSLLPHCRDCVKMHAKRASYQAYIWLHVHKKFHDIHGWKVENENAI